MQTIILKFTASWSIRITMYLYFILHRSSSCEPRRQNELGLFSNNMAVFTFISACSSLIQTIETVRQTFTILSIIFID